MTTPIHAGEIITAADLNAGVQPGTVLIEEITLTSNTQPIHFNDVPTIYSHLMMVARGGVTGSQQRQIFLRFNDDNTADNYEYFRTARVANGTFRENFDAGASGAVFANWNDSQIASTAVAYFITAGGGASLPGQSTYTSTQSETADETEAGQTHFIWFGGGASVTKISLFAFASEQFLAGSVFSLYGLR